MRSARGLRWPIRRSDLNSRAEGNWVAVRHVRIRYGGQGYGEGGAGANLGFAQARFGRSFGVKSRTMTYYADLGMRAQIAAGPYVRAVGWLGAEHAHPKGILDEDAAAKLRVFAERWFKSTEDLAWPCAGGAHQCDLCGDFYAAGNFGVPAPRVLYVCPEMVAHYVDAHGYLPPAEFIEALLESPLPGTPAYQEAAMPFRSAPCRPT